MGDDIYLVLAHQFNGGVDIYLVLAHQFNGELIFTLFWLISLMGLIFTLF